MADTQTPADVLLAWTQANTTGDMDTWGPLVLDGFTYVHSSSTLETKAELMEAFRNGRRYSRWVPEAMETQDFGDTAVVTGIGHLAVDRDPPMELHVRFTATLLNRDGWKLAAFQTTRLPAE